MKNNEFEYPDFLYEITIKSNEIDEPRYIFIYSNLNAKLFLKSIDGANYILMSNPTTCKHKFISTKEIIEVNEIDPFSSKGNNRQYIYVLHSNECRSMAYKHIE